MQTVTTLYSVAINAQRRSIQAILDLYTGDALTDSFQSDRIVNIEVQRTGEPSKFFGFGVSHKATIKLLDRNRELNITKENYFKLQLGVETLSGIEYKSFPKFFVTEVTRDEKTNELTITAYDALEKTTVHTVSELDIAAPYTIRQYADALAIALTGSSIFDTDISTFGLEYPEGANLEGTETFRDVLNAIAEATQTIYYIGFDDLIHFRRLDNTLNKSITKDIYMDLTSGINRTLQTIASVTELGDNISASTETAGETQYIRNNPFWELREDVATLVDDAVAAIGDIAIQEFSCQWRGDPALEPGDKIAYITKDDEVLYSYLINDTITYNGGLQQKTDWEFTKTEETPTNPSSLGEVIKQTYAKVDKANKQVEILVSEVDENSSAIAAIQANTESISASVSAVEKANKDAIDTVNKDIGDLTKKVEATITSEDVKLEISSALENGVDKVVTSTGFTFNEEGLTINKTGSEMTTNIDEDGMSVYRDNEEVLTADNQGVTAYNLHAKTYLIVGESSRFEDYENEGETRTGCFWIGGN